MWTAISTDRKLTWFMFICFKLMSMLQMKLLNIIQFPKLYVCFANEFRIGGSTILLHNYTIKMFPIYLYKIYLLWFICHNVRKCCLFTIHYYFETIWSLKHVDEHVTEWKWLYYPFSSKFIYVSCKCETTNASPHCLSKTFIGSVKTTIKKHLTRKFNRSVIRRVK